ncbi:MAG: glycosyltransferase family 4 protein [Candidatus Competibacter sp.]|nr:glycosyltransferase family 4 protein [Candidatus Competibacter sp.]
MKVALVAQPYDGILPPNQNSIGLIAYNTAIEMGRQAEVTLYGKRRIGVESSNDLPFKVSFVSNGSDDALQYVATHYPKWASRLRISAIADRYPGYARLIAKELDKVDYDVIHVINYWSWCQRFRGKKEHNRRIILEMQAEWLSQMDEEQVGSQLETTDAVVAVSDHIARLFRMSFPTYRGAVVTAYNGVNVKDFQPAPRQNGHHNEVLPILFVGRVSPEKGIHTLIEAFARIASQVEQAQLVIVGARATLREDFIVSISADPLVRALNRFYNRSVSSDYQCYLDDLVKRLRLTNKVRFIGRLPHKELVEWYRSSSIVVNPSLSESFGISIVEGMACGVPVVGTKVGGMLETILNGETGLLVEPERPDLLADAIVSLLKDTETAQTMGANGRSRAVEHFSWRARVDRLLSAYRLVLD